MLRLGVWPHIVSTTSGLLIYGALLSAQDLGATVSHDGPLVPLPEGRYISLEQAQQAATQADTPMAKLGQLEVEAARQNRLAVRADYFPKLGTAFANLHFSKFMGQELSLIRPIQGGVITRSVPLLGQDSTLVAVTVAQPVTQLFQVRQAVAVARADENIARAKAGMRVTQTASAVEKNYFDLLVAQKQMALAEARVRNAQAGRLVASTVPGAGRAEPSGVEAREANRALQESAGKVRELTASLNELLGWPMDTPLELEPPVPLGETLSLQDAVAKALDANPEVIEAQQNVDKAEAASKLSKLDYVPGVAVIGGWVYQSDLLPVLPKDFAYVGVFGTYNLFDFGKREHVIKARDAQVQMARTALELTKAKVGAAVKTTYLELEQARAMSEMARGAGTATGIFNAKYDAVGFEIQAAQTLISLEMLRLDYRHREAYGKLKALMGQP